MRIAVLDATETPRAIIVGFSMGAQRALLLAANHPDRVEGGRLHRPELSGRRASPFPHVRSTSGRTSSTPTRAGRSTTAGTGRRDYRGFLEFFFSQIFTEPHSTKPIEDCVDWGLETTAETLGADPSGS